MQTHFDSPLGSADGRFPTPRRCDIAMLVVHPPAMDVHEVTQFIFIWSVSVRPPVRMSDFQAEHRRGIPSRSPSP